MAACQRYFRKMEILKHWSIVRKIEGQKGVIGMCWSERIKRMLTFWGRRCSAAQKVVGPSKQEERLRPCAAGEEGSEVYGYAYVGVLALDGEGRD